MKLDMEFQCLLLIFAYMGTISADSHTGSFWHVTDFHWDPTYTTTRNSCQESAKQGTLGRYGTILCDPPWTLINSSVYEMKKIEPNPDFILWTGDDTAHDKHLNEQLVLNIIGNLTDLLKEVFPNTKVYSALGNHDFHPKHQLPPQRNSIYEAVADMWSDWIEDDEADRAFRNGGFYTIPFINPGFRVVSLNTNFYYTFNKVTANMTDPADQFVWFDEVMNNATRDGEKVYVIGHVTPGHYERHRNKSWFYPHYNKKLTELLIKHAGSIVGMFFAHHHTDTFKMFYNSSGTPVASMFITPAVSPWERNNLPNVIGSAANNPTIRLFKYNRNTAAPTDIWQYYLNLTDANLNGEADWQLEYKATEYFNITDISVSSLQKVVNDFKKPNSESFRKYYDYNTARINPGEECNDLCKAVHICSITDVDYDGFETCINTLIPTTPKPSTTPITSTGASQTPLHIMSTVVMMILVLKLYF